MAAASFNAVFFAAVVTHETFVAHALLVPNLTDTLPIARALVWARHHVAGGATPSGTAVAPVFAMFLKTNAIA